jgi:hypothetical protein
MPSEDGMVTGPAIAAERDDRLLAVTRSAFAGNGLITDATRTFAGHQTLNSSTASVARRGANGMVRARPAAPHAAGHVR